MAKLSIDLTNYKSNGDYVNPGTYEVIVDELEMTKTKAGDPMINVWFVIQKGDEAGRTVMDRFPIMDKALWRVVKFLNAVGIRTPRRDVTIDTAKIKNRRLVITVVDGKPYNNRVRSEVDDYFPAKKSAVAEEPSDVEEAEDDAEEMAVPEESVSTADVPAEPDADEVADDAEEIEDADADDVAEKGASPADAGKPETAEEAEDEGDLDDLEDLEL